MLIAATYCPLFRPFALLHWDMYNANKPYGIVVLIVAIVGIIGVVLMQTKVARMAAWLSLVLIVLVLFPCPFKNTYFFYLYTIPSISQVFSNSRSNLNGDGGYWLPVRCLSLAGVLSQKNRLKIQSSRDNGKQQFEWVTLSCSFRWSKI